MIGIQFRGRLSMGWPSTVNFSKERRTAPALPRPVGGVWAISNETIASPATAPIITIRFISSLLASARRRPRSNGLIRDA